MADKFSLFGYEISKKIEKSDTKREVPSLVPNQEPADQVLSAGGHFGQYVNLGDSNITNINDIIRKYRALSNYSEVDLAVNDIVDQAIVSKEGESPVSLDMQNLDQPDSVKKEITKEFKNILNLLNFNEDASDIFRRWYVDGRLYYHIMVDFKKLSDGIVELRPVDPTKIRKVREEADRLNKKTGHKERVVTDEYYVYGEMGSNDSTQGVKVDKNGIVFVPSGLIDESGTHIIGHLHKALKTANQLRMLEDSLIIYRISRAPERRIFYIDIGNLPTGKGEEYVNNIMSRYRNKMVYDMDTGEVKDDQRSMAMLEDFWLPRREGAKGTQIETLSGGENLGQIDDVIFFQRKLYKSLNVPIGRLESDNAFSVGRATEITREEVKFQKFIDRIRRKFSKLLLDLLEKQLVLKNVIKANEWSSLSSDITIDFSEDNYFSELKEHEIIRERITLLSEVGEYVGTYFSNEWVKKNILNQKDDEIDMIKKQIDAEKKSGEIQEPEEF